jgi:hypothetical protein
MKKLRRYAQGTSVPVVKTRMAIEKLLRDHGANEFASGSDLKTRKGYIGFTINGRQYRVPILPRPVSKKDVEQIEREQWRAMLLVIKAKLEFIASGLSTPEREFLADAVLPNGSTVGDYVEPRLKAAYENGEVRALLPE